VEIGEWKVESSVECRTVKIGYWFESSYMQNIFSGGKSIHPFEPKLDGPSEFVGGAVKVVVRVPLKPDGDFSCSFS
jgi:hypothetical protein